MSASGVKNFMAAVDLIFPMPQFNGDKARQQGWAALMVSELAHYPDDVLADVGKKIVRERKPEDGRFFPLLSEIRELCDAVMASKRALETPLLAGPTLHPFAAERFALARDLAKTQVGKQAEREGWSHEFFQYCVANMRAPAGKDIEACKEKSKNFQAEMDRCMKTPGAITQAWARYAQRMVDKARQLMTEGAA